MEDKDKAGSGRTVLRLSLASVPALRRGVSRCSQQVVSSGLRLSVYLALSSDDRGRLVAGNQEGALVRLVSCCQCCAVLLVAAKLWGLNDVQNDT